MKIKWIKVPVLIVLIVMSIVQMSKLWFEEGSSRNFFYNFWTQREKEGINELISGDSFLLNAGTMAVHVPQSDRTYVIKKNRPEYNRLITSSQRFLQQVLFNGENKGITLIDWPTIWNNQSIIIDLPFYMTMEMLLEDINVVKGIEDEDFQFNSIVIIPSRQYATKSKCYLINTEFEQEMLIEYDSTTLAEINYSLLNMIGTFQNIDLPVYLSSKRMGLTRFRKNILFPINDQDLMYSTSIKGALAFIEDGSIDLSEFEKFANPFFASPVAKSRTVSDESVVYKSQGTTIRYMRNGMLDYSEIRESRRQELTVTEAYRIAERFLAKDTKLPKGEIQLANFLVNDNEVIFYYNYVYNNFPIELSDEVKRTLQISYPIELIVRNDYVRSYRRWLLDEETITFEPKAIETNYTKVLDFFYELQPDNGFLEDMYLAYYLEDLDSSAHMLWIIEAKERYRVDIKLGED